MKRSDDDHHSDLGLFAFAATSGSESSPAPPAVTDRSWDIEKRKLFQNRFATRPEYVPVRWENGEGRIGFGLFCRNEWIPDVCLPKHNPHKCASCDNRDFVHSGETTTAGHLSGNKPYVRNDPVQGADALPADRKKSNRTYKEYVIGAYPVLAGDVCKFVAIGFGERSWVEDASEFLATCAKWKVPASIERAREGHGGRVWIFFPSPIAARLARRLAASLVTETMDRRPQIGVAVYDSIWPAEDLQAPPEKSRPIDLPFQARQMARGCTVFLDTDFRPHADQWAYLASVGTITAAQVEALVGSGRGDDRCYGIARLDIDDFRADKGTYRAHRAKLPGLQCNSPLPPRMKIRLANRVFIDTSGVSPDHVARLLRLATFRSGSYVAAQKGRNGTMDRQAVVSRARLGRSSISLPRFCLERALVYIGEHGSEAVVTDERSRGRPFPPGIVFTGQLDDRQSEAFDKLVQHDFGVMKAPPSYGKTVVSTALVAARQTSTLILVPTTPLLKQWVEAIRKFTTVPPEMIGTVAKGKWKTTGIIDVALIQGVKEKGVDGDDGDAVVEADALSIEELPDDFLSAYGQVVVDECHHLAAATYEAVLSKLNTTYVLAMSATPKRRDGMEPVMFMQCGPVRYELTALEQAAARGIGLEVIQHRTDTVVPASIADNYKATSTMFSFLGEDEERNGQIVGDVLSSIRSGRSPVILTEQVEHVRLLGSMLAPHVQNIVIMHGQVTAREKKAAEAAMKAPADESRLIVAGVRYLGEGFDDTRLDDLFIAMPLSWEGRLEQFSGRLQRPRPGKTAIRVHDYVDYRTTRTVHMWRTRLAGYRKLGFELVHDTTFRVDPEESEYFVHGDPRSGVAMEGRF